MATGRDHTFVIKLWSVVTETVYFCDRGESIPKNAHQVGSQSRVRVPGTMQLLFVPVPKSIIHNQRVTNVYYSLNQISASLTWITVLIDT